MVKHKRGSEVIVNLPDADDAVTEGMRKFQGIVGTISDIKTLDRGNTTESYYELAGAVSDKGVPYGFIGSWLIVSSRAVLKI